MAPITFIDPHVHLWHPRETPRAVTSLVRALGWSPRLVDWVARRAFPRDALDFFASPEYVTRPYLPTDLDSDTAHHQVDGVVHIEAGWEGKGALGPVEETRWLANLTAVGAGRVEAIVARADLALGEDVRPVIAAHLEASDRVRGIRETLTWHPSDSVLNGGTGPGRMQNPAWRKGLEELAGLSLEATCYDLQLDALSSLAEAYPDQPVMLSHLGTPVAVGGPFGDLGHTPSERKEIRVRWEASMARLAEHTNVCVKLSGLAMPVCGFGWERSDQEPSVAEVCDAMGPLITFAIEAFGVERCMFASNFPIDKVGLSYGRLFDAYLSITADRTPQERDALFRGNAARFYRLDGA